MSGIHKTLVIAAVVALAVARALAGDAVVYSGPEGTRLEVTALETPKGSARYELWRGEALVWSTTSTLVAEDLVLMPDLSGVGYCEPGGPVWGTSLDVLWISPKGAIEVLGRFPKGHDPTVKANPPRPAEPTPAGILVAGPKTAVVRLYTPMHEATAYTWVVVNSETKRCDVVTPDHPRVPARGVGEDGLPVGGWVREVSAQYVEAAHAILVHWLVTESGGGSMIRSAHFSLLDLSGATIWEHECYDDYRALPRRLTWLDYFKEHPQVSVDGTLITVHAIRADATRYFRIVRIEGLDVVRVEPLNELPGHDLADLPSEDR